ncbi:MAG: RnfABCDGE type electron transport complex subunit B [Bacteroidetes bacterium]|nr:RnfABCDGE type electron transport complex subunit B [Bacteroidota bacterium]
MDINILIAIATMGGLGFIFAGALAIADKKLYVEEDPRIAKVNEVLPGVNCGACGKAGCYDFAVNVVEGEIAPSGCPVGGQEVANDIANILGIDAGTSTKIVARVLCRGGNIEAARKMVEYRGPQTCSTMDLVSGGTKMCQYGCLGGGDCVEACTFNAIHLNDNGLPVVIDDLCTGCGMCVTACPRDIIELHPADREVFVFCKSHDDPKTAKEVCDVACIGCGICARKSDGGVIMEDGLAVIQWDKFDPDKIPFDKCKTSAICYLREAFAEYQVEEKKEASRIAPEQNN